MLNHWISKKQSLVDEIKIVRQKEYGLQLQLIETQKIIKSLENEYAVMTFKIEHPLFQQFSDIFPHPVLAIIEDCVDFSFCAECNSIFSKFTVCFHKFQNFVFTNKNDIDYLKLKVTKADDLELVFSQWQHQSMFHYLRLQMKAKNLEFVSSRHFKVDSISQTERFHCILRIILKSYFDKESRLHERSYSLQFAFEDGVQRFKIFQALAKPKERIIKRQKR
jgi:hypothetical protein